MSKLDYITIGIVSACIIAILFLVYKMTNIFKNEESAPIVETVDDATAIEDDIYDYQIRPEDSLASETSIPGESGAPASKSPATTTPSSTPATSGQGVSTPATTPATTPAGGNIATTKPAPTEPIVASEGRFLVLAGAFTQMSHAEKEVARLKQKGYPNAKVERFDRGKYAVVLVDRFNNMADAEKLVKQLKTNGIDCYVKIQEGGN